MDIANIQQGKGICILDPHGDIVDHILHYIPHHRIQHVIYFNTTDTTYPLAYNPLRIASDTEHHLIASGLIATFKKIWADSWGPRLEYILHFALLTLLEYGEATLLDIQPLLTDKAFREHVVARLQNGYVRKFWLNEFEKYPFPLRIEAITPILNKTGLFITNEPLRHIIGHRQSSFAIQEVLEDNKILLCNLSKGAIGEEASSLLGSMLLSSLYFEALQRGAQPENTRAPFFVYVDEMHSFITLSFKDILAEARKYGLGLFLTHQYLEQLPEKIRAAIIGNVGTLIAFRVGAEDAMYLRKEFHPVFDDADLISLPSYSMYIKLMIDGTTSKPFSATTLPIPHSIVSYKAAIIEYSRARYANHDDIEEKIERVEAQTVHMKSEGEQKSLFEEL